MEPKLKAIMRGVKHARNALLDAKYDDALEGYKAADQQIADYLVSCPAGEQPSWRQLREALSTEAHLAREARAEVLALVHPSEAVRRERQQQHQPAPIQPPLPQQAPPAPSQAHASPRVAPRGEFGHQNERLYGDRDRFGPPAGPGPVVSTRKVPQPNASPDANHGSPLQRRAPPPVVNKRSSIPARGGGGRGAPPAGRPHPSVPRFTGRAGEEELVQLVEADMQVGPIQVSWSDIAGCEEAKSLLEEAVVYPVLMPDYYTGIRRPWKGVLMYGPPGTGKTMLAKAVAAECGTTFFNISPATLTSKWRGESEKLIRVLFEMARHYAPSTIFIDEIDSLCGSRGDSGEHEASRRAKGTLLAQMDGVGVDGDKVVMVLGATNHPWDIDEAMRRRLEKRIYIALPDHGDRVELFKINAKSLTLGEDVSFEELSNKLEGHFYSGADITTLVREASMMTMRRYMDKVDKRELRAKAAEIARMVAAEPITMADFLTAMQKVPSSINAENIGKFEKWKKEFELNI